MQNFLTENEAARMRFEELQAQSEEADLSEVVRDNSIVLLGDANFVVIFRKLRTAFT